MTMRVNFNFPYGVKIDDALAAVIGPLLTPPLAREDDGKVQSFTTYSADLERLMPLLPDTIRLEVQGAADARPMLELADSLARIERRLDHTTVDPATYVNTKVDVHVPGTALLMIDDVTLWPDCCTEELQAQLNDGWRIVAICPQPDQRRPDYILGRRKPLDE